MKLRHGDIAADDRLDNLFVAGVQPREHRLRITTRGELAQTQLREHLDEQLESTVACLPRNFQVNVGQVLPDMGSVFVFASQHGSESFGANGFDSGGQLRYRELLKGQPHREQLVTLDTDVLEVTPGGVGDQT